VRLEIGDAKSKSKRTAAISNFWSDGPENMLHTVLPLRPSRRFRRFFIAIIVAVAASNAVHSAISCQFAKIPYSVHQIM
jgi:hypothetical protein